MSVGTRIVFTRFLTIHSSKLVPWQEHTRRVAGVQLVLVEDSDAEPAIVWKLASANNRTLGRSAAIYSAFDDARADAESLVARAHELESRLASNELSGAYGWFLEAEGTPSVVCARWYSTARDRNQSLEIARTALAAAVVETGARPLGSLPYGTRR